MALSPERRLLFIKIRNAFHLINDQFIIIFLSLQEKAQEVVKFNIFRHTNAENTSCNCNMRNCSDP